MLVKAQSFGAWSVLVRQEGPGLEGERSSAWEERQAVVDGRGRHLEGA